MAVEVTYFVPGPQQGNEALIPYIEAKSNAIILGTFDSGMVPAAFRDGIAEATNKGIPVFGIPRRMFTDGKTYICGIHKIFESGSTYAKQYGSLMGPIFAEIDKENADIFMTHMDVHRDRTALAKEIRENPPDVTRMLNFCMHIQPEMVAAGLVPIQGYPQELFELAEIGKAISSKYPDASLVFQTNGDATFNSVHDGMVEICTEHEGDYDAIVTTARNMFSTPEFNARIDEALEKAR